MRAAGRRQGRLGLAALTATIGAALVVMLTAAPAWAHDELLSSSPAADDVLSSPPADVRLTFSEELQASSTMAALTRDGGQAVEAPPFVVQEATIIQPFPAAAPSGRYTLAYRVASTDGHPIQGSVSFDLQVVPATADATTAAPSPPSPAATPAVSDAANVHEDESSAHRDIVVVLAIVGGLLLCAIIWLVSARRAARREAGRSLARVGSAGPASGMSEPSGSSTASSQIGESGSEEEPGS